MTKTKNKTPHFVIFSSIASCKVGKANFSAFWG